MIFVLQKTHCESVRYLARGNVSCLVAELDEAEIFTADVCCGKIVPQPDLPPEGTWTIIPVKVFLKRPGAP